MNNLPVDDVFVFLDSCFSGEKIFEEQNRAISHFNLDGQNTYQKAINRNDKVSVFAASDGSQFSWSIKQAEHGIFTYALAHGLSGKADTDNNKRLEYRELGSYLVREVRSIADNAIQQLQIPTFILKNNTEKRKVTTYE